MYRIEMVIGVNHRVEMPNDNSLSLSEAAYRVQLYASKYTKSNPNSVRFLCLDNATDMIMFESD